MKMKCLIRHKWVYSDIDLKLSEVMLNNFNNQYWFPVNVYVKPSDSIVEITKQRICMHCLYKEIKYQNKWKDAFLNKKDKIDISLSKLGI